MPNINIRIVLASVENDGDDNIFHIFAQGSIYIGFNGT